MSEAKTIDYGPLAGLIGTWQGDRGMDVAPEPEGDAESPYFETLCFEAGGDVTNAEEQVLVIVPYRQVVSRKSTGEVFHHELGYWLWDRATGVVVHSLQIPRAVAVLAGGRASTAADGSTVLEVSAREGDPDWGILQAPFMRAKARTTAFHHRITVKGDRLQYEETTTLSIYGRADVAHTDRNELTRVAL